MLRFHAQIPPSFLFQPGFVGLLLGLLFGKMALQATIDIQMHNTYFVLGNYAAQIGLLLLVVVLVLAADSLKRRARASKPLLGLLAGGSLLLELLLCISSIHTGFIVYSSRAPGSTTAIFLPSGVLWTFVVLHIFLLLTASWASIRLLRLAGKQPAA